MDTKEYFKIRNWEQLQHYKDRVPPWIKLYNDILENYEFSLLEDHQKFQIVAIYLLASRTNNRIPANPQWIQKKIDSDNSVDLDLFFEYGFIEKVTNASKALAKRSGNRTDSVHREEKRREEENNAQKRFDYFWSEYPNKKSKAKANKIFLKLNPDDGKLSAMIQAIGEQKRERERLQEKNEFVPNWKNPDTWLNGECWNDETGGQDPSDELDNPFRGAV